MYNRYINYVLIADVGVGDDIIIVVGNGTNGCTVVYVS